MRLVKGNLCHISRTLSTHLWWKTTLNLNLCNIEIIKIISIKQSSFVFTDPVRNVHPNASIVVINGTIECQSDASPPAFNYEWVYLGPTQHPMNQALGNSTDIDIFKTTERFLTLFTSGEFNFSCTAFNLVKNISYNSTWTGVISDSSGILFQYSYIFSHL